ncbi:MAG TPA: hypothetical protein PKA54_05365 [Chitinophagaceae bacterium]|nr:hypothetical protein [Chitinophagaceae bacterium]
MLQFHLILTTTNIAIVGTREDINTDSATRIAERIVRMISIKDTIDNFGLVN